MSNIVDTLNRLGHAAETSVNYLNKGGCCVFAALVGRELVNRGYVVKGVVVSFGPREGKCRLDDVRRRTGNTDLVDWYNDLSFNHVGIEFRADGRTRRYDSNGVVGGSDPLLHMNAHPDRLTVEELEAFAADPNWNTCFDRKQIPKLKKLVKQYFRDVTKVDGTYRTA